MMRRLSPIAVLGSLLAACAGTPDAPLGAGAAPAIPVPVATAAEDLERCDGNGLVRYVGAPLVMPGDPLPTDGAYVSWQDLPPGARVLEEGARATMDYKPARLNVVLTVDRRIHRLYCG
ncbi:I78 family peptidase inhibitor [Novispirillum sp. DQ9]|uniref:I78 family peptidase inhibitor n=1 Tax=Novispirillum sp. DQ9 TaxID=3398612 RepID=UPI003C7BD76F